MNEAGTFSKRILQNSARENNQVISLQDIQDFSNANVIDYSERCGEILDYA